MELQSQVVPKSPALMSTGFVIAHPGDGVFVGAAMGLGFWSKVEDAGQVHAPAFDSPEDAEAFMASWTGGRPAGAYIVNVVLSEPKLQSATMADCVRAGLPAWTVDERPCMYKFALGSRSVSGIGHTLDAAIAELAGVEASVGRTVDRSKLVVQDCMPVSDGYMATLALYAEWQLAKRRAAAEPDVDETFLAPGL